MFKSGYKFYLACLGCMLSFGLYTASYAQDTLLTESFESGVIPTSYTVIDNDADGNGWVVNTYPHTGTYSLSVKYNASGSNDWLLLPVQDLSGYDSVSFSFWARSDDSFWKEDFDVKLSTSGSGLSSYTTILGEEREISTTYTKFEYDLTAYTGQNVYLAIHYNAVDKFYLYVDDLLVTGKASSTTPANVVANFSANVTSGSAPLTVQFSDQSTNAASWTWDFDNDGTIDATASTNPIHTYQQAGVYSVSLTVSDGSGNSDTEVKTDYITVTDAGNTITSTTAGGAWSDTTTWIGYVVPTENDNVVINGDVNIDGHVYAKNLTINSGKVVQNEGYNDALFVKGSLQNYGTIQDNPSGYDFHVYVYGDVNNYGSIANYQLHLSGTADHYLSMNTTAEFRDLIIASDDTSSTIIAASDIVLTDSKLTFAPPGTGYPGWFELPEGSGFNLYLDNSHTTYLKVRGGGNSLVSSNNAYLSYHTSLNNINLEGTTQIDGGDVYIKGNSVNIQDTLQNLSYNDFLKVQGTLQNYGVIRDNPSGYDFHVYVNGDVNNYGSINNYQLHLSGTADHYLSMSSTAEFRDLIIASDDTSSTIIAASDIVLTDSKLTFAPPGTGYPGWFELPEGSGFNLYLDNSYTTYLKVRGGGNSLVSSNGSYLSANTYLNNINLEGTTQIDGGDVYLQGNTVNIQDTLQNLDYNDYLNVMGTLQNNGVIRDNPSGYDFHVYAHGDVNNFGSISNYRLSLTGSADHYLSMSSTAEFRDLIIASDDTSSTIIAASDIVLTDSKLTFAPPGQGFPGWFELPEGSGFKLYLDNTHITYVKVRGGGNSLVSSNNAYLSGETYLSDISLEGITQIDGESVYLTGSSVIIEDTLQNLDYNDYLNVMGTLQNNGVIRDNPSGYDFHVYAHGDVNNFGSITNYRLSLTGSADHYLSMSSTAEFRDLIIASDDTSSTIIAASDIVLTNSQLSYAIPGTGFPGWFELPEGSGFKLYLDNSHITYVKVRGGGNSLVSNNNAYLSGQMYLSDISLEGITQIDGESVYLTGSSVIIEDTLQNLDYNDQLIVMGTLQNNGMIRDNPSGYDFMIQMLGNLINYGTINNYRVDVKSTETQYLSMPNSDPIGADVYLFAEIGSSGYQWYHNNEAIENETSSILSFAGFGTADAGTYYTTSNAGNSRSVIVTAESISPVSGIYVAKNGSDQSGDGSETSPYATIQHAVDQAASGDQIFVDAGTYAESISITGKDVQVISLNGPEETIIDATDLNSGFMITGGTTLDTKVSGFTIKGGFYGVMVEGANAVIAHNILTENSYGVFGNINWTSGVGADVQLLYNLIHHNSLDGVQLAEKGDHVVTNNTIADNEEAGLLVFFASATVRNNILVRNGSSGLGFHGGDGNTLDMDYNLVWGNTTDYTDTTAAAHDVHADPLFVSSTDYHLQEASPAIDAGDPATEFNDKDGTRNDIGAFYVEGGNVPVIKANFLASAVTGLVPLEVQFTDTSSGDITGWNWSFGDGAVSTEKDPLHTYNTTGKYTVTLIVSDGVSSDTLSKRDYIQVYEPPVSLSLKEFKIFADDGRSSDNFGYRNAVDIDGDYAIVGAYSADLDVDGTGAAYIFHWDGEKWVQQSKLIASDAQENDWFGTSVAIQNDLAVVGAPGYAFAATTPGSAYLYKRNGDSWSEIAILNPDDGQNEDRFGSFVDLDSGYVAVGAYGNNGSGVDKGAVYIYTEAQSAWKQHQKLVSDQDDPGTTYGYALSMDAGDLLVGHPGGYHNGTVYHYVLADGSWTLKDKIQPAGITEGESFGYSISNDSNRMAVASAGYETGRGKIYVFDKDPEGNWIEAASLTVNNPEYTGFGYNVALNGSHLLAGAHEDDHLGYNAGLAYLFQYNGTSWVLSDTLGASDKSSFAEYGMSVAADQDRFIIGAHGAGNGNVSSTGAAYIYMEEEMGTEIVADFSADVTSGNAPLAVQFNDQSSGEVTAWHWSFGDGNSSTDQNPAHTYSTTGIYDVKLIVSNTVTSDSLTKEDFISVTYQGTVPDEDTEVWTWLNPLPQGNAIWDVHSPDGFTAYAVGSNGTVLKTSNGGTTWDMLKTLPGKEDLFGVYFLNAAKGYITGSGSVVYKTTDGGESWTEVSPSGYTFYEDIFFLDELKGFIVGPSGELQITIDGGNSWSEITSNVARYLNDILFIDANTGFIVGGYYDEEAYILKTVDGGMNWTVITSPVNKELNHIQFVDNQHGFISGDDGALLKTIDGGNNWTDISTNDFFDLNTVYFEDANTGIAIGNNIWKTTDGGVSWTEIEPEVDNEMRAVFINTDGSLYLFDVRGGIHESVDHGDTWHCTYSYYYNRFDAVDFYNSQYGIFAGETGILLRTTDGGATLQEVENKSYHNINDVQFVNKSTVIAVTDDRYFLRSKDGGQSWTEINTTEDGGYSYINLNTVAAVNDDVYYVAGDEGVISKTLDGGDTWTDISYSTDANISDLYFFDENTGLAIGDGTNSNLILRTIDGGLNWTAIVAPVTDDGLNQIDFIDENTGYIAGEYSLLLKTTDAGVSWTDVSTSIDSYYTFGTIDFTGDGHGLITATSGYTYKTEDGGISWYELGLHTDRTFYDLYLSDEGIGYGVSYYGTIMKLNIEELEHVGLLADFRADTQTVHLDQFLAFKDQSIGAVSSWTWDFGDGNGSTEQHPEHQYTTPGVYTVTLTVSDGTGEDITAYSDYVTVLSGTSTEELSGLPTKLELEQNYPNPFNPTTRIKFALPSAEYVELNVYNILGQRVKSFIREVMPAGYHSIMLESYDLSSGFYIYELKTHSQRLIQKMTIIK